MRPLTLMTITAIAFTLMPAAPDAAPRHCPPGLAKKSPACVPPGLAKKGADFQRGDRIVGEYSRLRSVERYGLVRDQIYYRVGDYLYRVNPETKEVLDLVGAIAQVLR